jgi:uncharacterized damage-inducible protein DinB/putative sterol carrier protein
MTEDAGVPQGGQPRTSPVDKARAASEVDEAVHQLCQVLRSARDLEAAAVGHWSARDVAVHLAESLDLYTRMATGTSSPAATIDAIADLNEQLVTASDERDARVLAGPIETAAAAYTATARATAGDPDVPWHAGLRTPLSTLLATTLGEVLVHGHDIARAVGAPWHASARWASTVFQGLLPVLPALTSERATTVRARFDVRLRGDPAARAAFSFADGGLTVEPGRTTERVDCHLSADPASFLLVMYGRMGPVRPAVTGRVVAWGRRPWLGLALPSLFRRP